MHQMSASHQETSGGPEGVGGCSCKALQDGAQAAQGQVRHVHPGSRLHDRAAARQHQAGTRCRHAPHHAQRLPRAAFVQVDDQARTQQ